MQFLEQLKTSNPALRVRRNHALEHATLQILAEKSHPHGLGGLSDTRGFWVFGEIDPETLMQAAEEARKRLNKGEHHLAIHPHCGTNFAAAGIVGGFFAWLAEILAIQDAEQLFFRRAEVAEVAGAAGQMRLRGRVFGEHYDNARHRAGTYIKAVTMHQLRVEKTPQGWQAQVYLDV